ncbi:type II secretion system protein N [Dokdonella sp.]|uniref:type II secretion system protein N n=1 Tax=Dokdonella sp. TaxID=2291710 RepID=UPI0031C60AFD|nr:PDZ domain-containing protein [Dokdonella sp.]
MARRALGVDFRRAAERLPWLACAVLAALAVWQLARIVPQRVPRASVQDVPGASASPEPAPPPHRSIASWHLFGTAPADRAGGAGAAGAAGSPTLSLILRGTLAEADPKAGVAVLGDAGSAERAVRVGEEVEPGIRLIAVYPDRAVFSQGGAEQTLHLPREPLPTPGGAVPRTPGTASSQPGAKGFRPPLGGPVAAASGVPASSGQGGAQDEIARARHNPGDLLQRFRIEPVFAGGALGGVRVSAAKAADGALLQQAGLQPGDVVTRIDGQPIDTLAAGQQALARLGNASSVRVTVERGGRPVEISISLR